MQTLGRRIQTRDTGLKVREHSSYGGWGTGLCTAYSCPQERALSPEGLGIPVQRGKEHKTPLSLGKGPRPQLGRTRGPRPKMQDLGSKRPEP